MNINKKKPIYLDRGNKWEGKFLHFGCLIKEGKWEGMDSKRKFFSRAHTFLSRPNWSELRERVFIILTLALLFKFPLPFLE